MQPATQEYLRQIADQLHAAAHGEKEPILARAQSYLGCSRNALYTKLATVGYKPERKKRADAGAVSLPRAEAEKIAALIKAATRQNGKRILSVPNAVDMLRANGEIAAERVDENTGEVVALSTTTILRALEVYGLHHKQLATPEPHVQLASLHPNHVWQMDFSVCVVFYLRGDKGVRIMDEARFNKNKPANVAKIENDRVQRVVIADHTSHVLWVYYARGGERSTTAIDALIRAMIGRDGVPYKGVCFVLYTDQGSAFKGGIFENFCRRALITHIRHDVGASRATGSVEKAQDIVERSFESRLGIGYRVEHLEELQALATRWEKWFNTTQRHSRHGMTRVDAWMRISEQQLRLAPSEAVLRTLATTHPKDRTVTGKLGVPWEGVEYSLRDVPGLTETLRVGMKVQVVTNPYVERGIIIVTPSADGADELHYPIAPPAVNEWGYAASAPIIGESFASLPKTNVERATERLEQIAFGADTMADVAQAKKDERIAFAGMDPHKPLITPDVTHLPRRGTELGTAAPVYVAPVTVLTVVEAARALRDLYRERDGGEWTADHYAALQRLYPNGLAEADLGDALDRITNRTRLRVVAGGAS